MERLLGCKIRKNNEDYCITSSDKKLFEILGITTIKIRLPNSEWDKVICTIITKLSDNLLLSCYSQKWLCIFPEGWYHCIFKARKAKTLVCPMKLYSLAPQKLIYPPAWPSIEWDEWFKSLF